MDTFPGLAQSPFFDMRYILLLHITLTYYYYILLYSYILLLHITHTHSYILLLHITPICTVFITKSSIGPFTN